MTRLLDPEQLGAIMLHVDDESECFGCGKPVTFPAIAWSGWRNPLQPERVVFHVDCARDVANALLADVARTQ